MEQFDIDSKETKLFNPGIARDVFGKVDPSNPKTLIVETHNSDYKRKIRFMGLASDSGTTDDVRAAVDELKIAYPVAAPTLKQLEVFGDIAILPTTWVVDRDGRIAKEFLGAGEDKQKQLREIVDQLLAK